MKKKILSIMLVLSIIFIFIPTIGIAETYGDLTYIVNYDDTIEITDCDMSVTEVNIPKEIYGLPVTSIRYRAFDSCTQLKSIIIPESIISIGSSAFINCENLQDVYITNLVAWCGINFSDYDSNPLCYADNLYINKQLLSTDIIIPNGVTRIGSYAFVNRNNLINVVIPDSVTDIGMAAFSGCNSLPSITIPNSVTHIGGWAFENCTNLENVIIGSSVISIGSSAFTGCENLASLYVPDFVSYLNFEFGNYSSNPMYYADNLYIDNKLVTDTDMVIPNSITNIGNFAFCGYSKLENITIPDSVTSIGIGAFSYCDGLTNITIPDSVTSIANSMFSNCTNLITVIIPEGVTTIGEFAFEECDNLMSITIPKSLTNIGESAFSYCRNLDSLYVSDLTSYLNIEFESSVANPMYYADKLYINNKRATNIEIPYGITKIPKYAFDGCDSITSVTIPDSVTRIEDNAFYDCISLESVYITDLAKWCGIDFGGYGANPLRYAVNLYINNQLATDIIIPGSVRSIEDNAFLGCDSITSVIIPNSVTSIGKESFEDCNNLTSIKIPSSVTSIGEEAFYNCENLMNIITSEGLTSIGDRAFYNCSDITDITIPNSVTSIGEEAFYNCESLTSITIPESVTHIGTGAFGACYALKSANYNASRVFSNVFDNTHYNISNNIELVLLGNFVKSIDKNAFAGCNKLKKIFIPRSVTEIEMSAFEDCISLADVYYGGSEEDWNQMYIGINNENLKNATIHYNSPLFPPENITLTTPTITISESENQWSFEVDVEQPYLGCTVYAALYDDAGAFIGVNAVPLELFEDTTTISVDKQGSETKAKVFVWLDGTQPITNTDEIPLVENLSV